ncbi:WD40 repeat domain-containing protein [Aggregatibacter actinomycetemcomitans]|uniref:WD40 repeat domain-containing protein n=1 Tax=Aggregatibacter actinomycetemcomitans TaxID=714 RepID=UPI00197C7E6C|nr:WD40 repeat domain-containing protein [Aggregatibacter actinomycetemcomitans]MBN6067460.1 WD40 repeat domain-containing protein [Aggregatibacter actinomycetemcomitans]MBN6085490.1 WD40 repeat domain-containing protein [Aggregatibacter actinomycetemcomitans]
MKRVLKLSCLILYTFALSACASGAPVMSTGVSTDGRYVITAHSGGGLYLWDIQKKEKKRLAKNAYSYSAYFIPDSHEFMWQDDNDIVHIQDVNGKEVKSFKHFKTEGQLMTADKSFYLSADTWGKLYKGYGDNLTPIYTDAPIGPSQPYSLSIVGNYILSSGNGYTPNEKAAETNLTANPINPDVHKKDNYRGVTLWDKTTLKPIARLYGNSGRTTGRISPDGKWVVTGSDNRGNFMWSIQNPNLRLGIARINDGIYDNKIKGYDKSKLLPVPEKFQEIQAAGLFNVLAVAFLTDKDFILFDRNAKDRIHPIYTTGDVWIQGYVDLGKRKSISQSNLSIGSSPKAHILVISQGSGIAVYRYHPETKELEKIWVAD